MGNNALIHRHHPKFKSIRFKPMLPIDDLITFIENNPSIRILQTLDVSIPKYIQENVNRPLNSTINLDELTINGFSGDITNMFDSLNQLHRRGFHRGLDLLTFSTSQRMIEQLSNLEGLGRLHLYEKLECVLPILTNLRQLNLPCGLKLNPKDIDILMRNLVGLRNLSCLFQNLMTFYPT